MKKMLFIFGILFLISPIACTSDYWGEDPLMEEVSETPDADNPDGSSSDSPGDTNTNPPSDNPSSGDGSANNPDATDPFAGKVTYQGDVKPILNQLCVACHNAQVHEDGVDLSTYYLAKENIDDILEAMQEDDYDDIMPPSGRVDDAIIETLYAWINDGLLEGEEPDPNTDTGPTDGTYSYTTDIAAIIDNQCILCHGANSPSAGFDISTYQLLVSQIDLVMARIDLQTGQAGIMPPAGRMNEATIQQIKDWIAQGMPE
jgi:mono/diheme cytochrome c family protein